jgi:hypothetical protein
VASRPSANDDRSFHKSERQKAQHAEEVLSVPRKRICRWANPRWPDPTVPCRLAEAWPQSKSAINGYMSITIQAMKSHITELCAQHDIQIEWHEREAWAARELELICIRPIRSAVTYTIALHEIGHILGRFQGSQLSIIRERWAWKWAKRNALVWTAVMERTMRCPGWSIGVDGE